MEGKKPDRVVVGVGAAAAVLSIFYLLIAKGILQEKQNIFFLPQQMVYKQ